MQKLTHFNIEPYPKRNDRSFKDHVILRMGNISENTSVGGKNFAHDMEWRSEHSFSPHYHL